MTCIFGARGFPIVFQFHRTMVVLVYNIVFDIISFFSSKYLTHRTKYIASFTPTTLDSVEIFAFIFYFVLIEIRHPLPMEIVDPVWLRMFGWTAQDASMHQLITLLLSASSVSLSSLVSWRNLRYLPSFFQSSSSGFCTLVHKNDIASSKSALVHFPRYNNFAVRWRNKVADAESSR